METINGKMRKGIKTMCVVCQTAQFVSLMPQPKDFVTRVVGDLVYLSSRVIKLSDDMNDMLDSYTDIPTNYLMTQMNSIAGSLSSITDRVSTYGRNAVNQVVGLGENATKMITELTGTAIDTTGALTTAVVGLGSAVAETTANLAGNTEKAEEIHDAAEEILEWTKDGFRNVRSDAVKPIVKLTGELEDIRTGVTSDIRNAAGEVNYRIEDARRHVEVLVRTLREKIEKLRRMIDSGFEGVTGLSSVSKGADKVMTALKESDNNSPSAQAATEMAHAISEVIKNFSIGKVVTAYIGVLAQSAIVRLGLDELPPIDFESMMCKIRNDLTVSSEELYRRYNDLSDSAYNDLIKFGEDAANIPSEDRNYSSKNYESFVSEFEGELKERRDAIRVMMKNTSNLSNRRDLDQTAIETQKKRELRSAIKEIEKYRKKIKKAKHTEKMKSVIGEEIDNFKKEAEYRCNSIKSDWKSMMDQYRKAIGEIKEFFRNGGSGDMFVEDCCKRINSDCDEIKELCKNLSSQLICSSIKVGMSSDIGPVSPNPAYKIADFTMDVKTIMKFIKDLITLVIDIINHINKLARIMLNGINNLNEIVRQLMDLIGLRWLMNLIQSVIDLFGDNIMNARERLENTLSPVYFSDTEEYNNTLDALDELMKGDGTNMTEEGKAHLSDVTGMLSSLGDSKDIKSLIKDIDSIRNKTSFSENDAEKIDTIIEDLEKQGEVVVAYKSPIIREMSNTSKDIVTDVIDKGTLDIDIQFIGWHFFHPNLNHTEGIYYGSKFMKKIKSKIIKKASKTGHKRSGGVNRLKKKTIGSIYRKRDKAYVAFYWYTYYTEDLEKECFDGNTTDNSIVIDNVVHTENGSVVELTDGRKVFVADNMVRSGDYVNVNGVKYRVK